MHTATPTAPRGRRCAAARTNGDVLAEAQLNVRHQPLLAVRAARRLRAAVMTAATTTTSTTNHRLLLRNAAHTPTDSKHELCKYLNLLHLKPKNLISDENQHARQRRSFRLKNKLLRARRAIMEKNETAPVADENQPVVVQRRASRAKDKAQKDADKDCAKEVDKPRSSDSKSPAAEAAGTSGATDAVKDKPNSNELPKEINDLLTLSATRGIKRKIVQLMYNQEQASFVLPIQGHRLVLTPLMQTKLLGPPIPYAEILEYRQSALGSGSLIICKKTVDDKTPTSGGGSAPPPLYKNLIQNDCGHIVSSSLDVNKNATSDTGLQREREDCACCRKKLQLCARVEDAPPPQGGIVDVVHVADKSDAPAPPPPSASSILHDHNYSKPAAGASALSAPAAATSAHGVKSAGMPAVVPYEAGDEQRAGMPLMFVKRSRSSHTLEALRAAAAVGTAEPLPVTHGHIARLSAEHGEVLSCHYVQYCLVVVQEKRVSYFQQSGLGMFLESQAMWIPRGHLQRLEFSVTPYARRTTEECVLYSSGGSVAYVELYCKEHRAASRAVPGCDIFIVVYYKNNADNTTKCKVLQLTKFTGFARDVQFVVIQKLNSVVVYTKVHAGTTSASTVATNVTSFTLSHDYEVVSGGYEYETSPHLLSSMHAIVDCDFTIVGYQKGKMSFWCGRSLVCTIEVPGDEYQCASFRCERGFIFALQYVNTRTGQCMLRLIGINASDFSQKILQVYHPKYCFQSVHQACMYDGEVYGFFKYGRACWSMESGVVISSLSTTKAAESVWPSGPWMITVDNWRVFVTRLWKSQGRRH